MNLLHSLSSLLHRRQRLTIDIRRLDRVNLLFQRRNLRQRLIKRMLMLLLSLQRCSCRCSLLAPVYSSMHSPHHCNHHLILNPVTPPFLTLNSIPSSPGSLWQSGKSRNTEQGTHHSYYSPPPSSQSPPARPSASANASPSSATSPAATSAPESHSSAHPCGSARSARRTSPTCLTSCISAAVLPRMS